jgi:hypothetical protein
VVRGILACRYSIRLLDRERRCAAQQLGDLLSRMRFVKARLGLLSRALVGPSNRRVAPTDPDARGIAAHGTPICCSVIAADSADVVVLLADAPRWTRVPRRATPTTVPALGPLSACRMVTNETSYCWARSRLDRSRPSGLSRLSIEGASSSAICTFLGREKR